MRRTLIRHEYPTVANAVRIALIGAGQRSSTAYACALEALPDVVTVSAVCDPVREHADALAQRLRARAFYDIRDLIRADLVEAAIVCAPIPLHFAYSVLLSSYGLHNLVETMWCSLVEQAHRMQTVAETNGVQACLAENFIRMPIDRFAQALAVSGELGTLCRVVSYSDFCGYHNNSRWLRLAGQTPAYVSGLSHAMRVPQHSSLPHRTHVAETFEARCFGFDRGFFVSDQAANVKGLLGRASRPGHTEWHCERGTLAYSGLPASIALHFNESYPFATMHPGPLAMIGTGELRRCGMVSTGDVPLMSGLPTEYIPVRCEQSGPAWSRVFAEGADLLIEFENALAPRVRRLGEGAPWDVASVVETVFDFALAVRKTRPFEVSTRDATMSVEMEMGAKESMLRGGAMVKLPIGEDLEIEALERKRLARLYAVDPLDVEAMLAVVLPRP